MSLLRTLRKLILGETWLLPLGVAAVAVAAGLVLKPLLSDFWHHAGGFILLAGVAVVLLASVSASARPRP
jgi:membrane protein implicated in regulation of membrane protease activity